MFGCLQPFLVMTPVRLRYFAPINKSAIRDEKMQLTEQGLKKAAEILEASGNYKSTHYDYGYNGINLLAVKDHNWPSQLGFRYCTLDPLKHDVDGINQAHIIEDWLRYPSRCTEWEKSGSEFFDHGNSHHKWRLCRIVWCLNKIGKENEKRTS